MYMHACVYGCVYASMILLDTLRRCYWGFLSVHACAYACVCVCACMCACMGACVRVCVCMYVFLCICVHVRLCARACGCTYQRHSCRRILFICTVQSLYYMRVYHRCFLTLACVCVGGFEGGFVSACSWLALVTVVGGYVFAGVEIGVLSCIFLYFCGC